MFAYIGQTISAKIAGEGTARRRAQVEPAGYSPQLARAGAAGRSLCLRLRTVPVDSTHLPAYRYAGRPGLANAASARCRLGGHAGVECASGRRCVSERRHADPEKNGGGDRNRTDE